MHVADVKQLAPLERFLYWIRERHAVYLKKESKKPKPWTDDEVLQRFFFTNPYRENDKVTKWFRKHIREPLRNDPRVLMATVIFRWFNYPDTAKILMDKGCHYEKGSFGWLVDWDAEAALEALSAVRSAGGQIFTGAYMINSPGGEPKLEAIIRRITNVWREHKQLLAELRFSSEAPSLQGFHRALTRFDGLGGFMAYEIVCDLRWTFLLQEAVDVATWCNPGPGCARGLRRLYDLPFEKGNNATSPSLPKNWLELMRQLLATTRKRLCRMPLFEMREIEHSLCEWDKYERALWGDGRMKRTYQGV